MAFLAPPADFLSFLVKQKFDDAQAEDVGRKLAAYEIFSPKEFFGFFSAGPSIYDFWEYHADWERKGGILSKLRDMLIKLQTHEKEALEESDRLLDSRLDNPIDKQTNETLTTTWLAKYSYRLHPTQECTHQILGSMWRSLMNRQITS